MKSDNPQQRYLEPLLRPPTKFVFVPGRGKVPDPNDLSAQLQYDVYEAVLESEEEMRRQRSYANVGYAFMKKRG